MTYLKPALALLLALLVSLFLLLTLAPATLLAPIARVYLAASGIELAYIERLEPGSRQTDVGRLGFTVAGYDIEVQGLALNYELTNLLNGRIDSVSVNQIDIQSSAATATATATGTEAPGQALSERFASLTDLPVRRVTVDRVRVDSPFGPVQGSLSLSPAPWRLESQLEMDAYPGLRVDLVLSATSPDTLSARAALSWASDGILETTLEMAIDRNDLRIDGDSDINLTRLQAAAENYGFPPPLQVLTETLHVSSRLTVTGPLNRPAIPDFSMLIDSPGSGLHLHWQLGQSSVDARLSLPLQLDATATTTDGPFQLSLQETTLTTTVSLGSGSVAAQARVEPFLTRCERLLPCAGEFEFQIDGEAVLGDQLQLENATLNGSLDLNYSDQGLRLLAPELALTLPHLGSPLGTGSLSLNLEDLMLTIDDSVAGSVHLATTSLNPGIDDLNLNNPLVYGDFQIADRRLAGDLVLSVNNQLNSSLAVAHDLADGRGSVELNLPEYRFSQLTPLSNLLTPARLPLDLVEGAVSAAGRVQWQRQDQGLWQFSGPLQLHLNGLSGYVLGNTFIDLDTDLNIEITHPPGVRTEGLQQASVASLDVGLPLGQTDWHYQFDSTTPSLTVKDFNTSMLGGNVKVPEFLFDPQQENNPMTVVLSSLDLESIVSLADYPNLQVTGLVSGYLPLLVSGSKVTVDEGLISALNPGGSIRYIPDAPSPAANRNVRLLHDALSNYQYESLNTRVYYSGDGELSLEVELRGVNPDMNGGQPINLNVNISDNVPTLLQSLRAGRTITDRLEQRLRQR